MDVLFITLSLFEKVSRDSISSLSFGGKFFLCFYLSKGAPGVKMAEIFQARAAIKTRVNAFKRESLSAQKIERVSLVRLVLASAVLRERNRSFFAIEKKRDTRERWFFRVDVTRFFSWGKRSHRFFVHFFDVKPYPHRNPTTTNADPMIIFYLITLKPHRAYARRQLLPRNRAKDSRGKSSPKRSSRHQMGL